MTDSARIDVLGFGFVALDELLHVDEYPAADAKAPVRRREVALGGLAGMALVAAARMGASCAYAGALGDDELSCRVLSDLRRERVSVTHVRSFPDARPVRSVIVVDETRDTRNIFYDMTGVRGPGDVDGDLVRSSRVVMVDNLDIATSRKVAQTARDAGIPVVADFDAIDGNGFPELLELVDHLILSAGTAAAITGADAPEESARRLATPGRDVVVVTAGAGGAWWLSRDEPRPRRQPPYAMRTRNPTGCGDVFHGVYAATLAEGLEPADRVRLASAAGALKAAGPPGVAGVPRRERVERLVSEAGDITI